MRNYVKYVDNFAAQGSYNNREGDLNSRSKMKTKLMKVILDSGMGEAKSVC